MIQIAFLLNLRKFDPFQVGLHGVLYWFNKIKLPKIIPLSTKKPFFIGKVLLAFEELPSTNDYAVQLLAKSKPSEGTVISAGFQAAGKGQIGSRWESEADKNLLFSVVLHPTFLPLSRQFLLNQAVSLSVRDFIASYTTAPVSVKWPNDIFIGHRKVAGLLLQSSISGTLMQSCVVGLGININQTHFPDHLPRATSLSVATGQTYALKGLLTHYCACLEARYLQLRAGRYPQIEADYRSVLYGYGQSVRFRRAEGGLFTGTIVGTAQSGQLLVDSGRGREAFQLKQVSLVELV